MSENIQQKAIIITAPSGAGKSTIANYLLEHIENFGYSVSATTRSIREGEEDGVDYYYISKESFVKKIEENEFVEWEEVYADLFYGTLKSEVHRLWAEGQAVLFVVDVVGAKDLKKFFRSDALSIFIEPPSMAVLKERLIKRGTETEASLKKRIGRAQQELNERDNFDLIIINDDLKVATGKAMDEVGFFIQNEEL